MATLGWKPIETAPKDGTRIIVWRPSAPDLRRVSGDYWEKGTWWYSRRDEQPSHWMLAQDMEP